MELIDFLQYGFAQRALVAGTFIALLCSTLGIFLVLRRFSLIGDGLAHATFGSVALAMLLNMTPLYASIPIVMACSLGILKLTEKARLYGDAAIGVVSSMGIATGIILSSIAGCFNVDLFSYLFGSILSISTTEVIISTVLSLMVILVIILYYHELMSITFDAESAKVSGINTKLINNIFVLLTAMTVVLSMKVAGILLISALFIFPPITALQIAQSFNMMIICSGLSAIISVISGIIVSFFLDLPTGATIVVMNFILFITVITSKKLITRR